MKSVGQQAAGKQPGWSVNKKPGGEGLPYIRGDHVEGSEIIPWVISFAVFFVVPFWKLFKRTGFKPVFSLIALIPGGVLLLLWVVAFAKWPAFAEKTKDSGPPTDQKKKDSSPPIVGKKKKSGPPIVEKKKDSSLLAAEETKDSGSPVVEEIKDSGPPVAEEIKDIGSSVEEKRDSGSIVAEEKEDSGPPVAEEKKDAGPPIPP